MYFTRVRDVKLPCRANSTDAGIDFFVPNDFVSHILPSGGDILIPSGIKVVVPKGSALVAQNKSGISTKMKLIVGAKVVDESYRGEVHIHMFNIGKNAVEIKPGMKIVQFILMPVHLENPIELDNLEYSKFENTDRGSGGFGSTGI